nr:MAG TPA: hypothetical protein [Caudoviricetes sp.]
MVKMSLIFFIIHFSFYVTVMLQKPLTSNIESCIMYLQHLDRCLVLWEHSYILWSEGRVFFLFVNVAFQLVNSSTDSFGTTYIFLFSVDF